ncbi:hypothetical protein [Streptomyces sp. CoH17]|uniref:hypothetical protein n=1 Tax=Streptomyces sp. CoH17 TaxID=2992806 RepID=UPI0022705C09|nr:hypothetical protein [Streptomyces sp. CoH17]
MFQPARKITAGEVPTVDFPMLSRTKESLDQDTTWFQSSRESIAERRRKVQAFASECRRYSNSVQGRRERDFEDVVVYSWIDAADREAKTLKALEAEYVDADVQEQLQSLPQYSVMAGRAPQVRLGENYTQRMPSDLYYEAPQSVDWGQFLYVEPPLFVRKNAAVAENSAEMRERAVDFIAVHASSIDSDVLKSQVIEQFVTGVERSRRQHLASEQESQSKHQQSKSANRETPIEDLSDSVLFF